MTENRVSQSEPLLLCWLLNVVFLFIQWMNILSDGGLDRLPGDRRAGKYDPLARARK